jgi:hypothetical protein
MHLPAGVKATYKAVVDALECDFHLLDIEELCGSNPSRPVYSSTYASACRQARVSVSLSRK